MAKFLTVCLNPVLQKTLIFNKLSVGEVNRTKNYYFDASGKGINVSRALKQLGAKEVHHLTHAGSSNRRVFLKLVNSIGIKIKAIKTKVPIRTCTTIIDSTNFTTTELVEESKHIENSCEIELLKYFYKAIADFDYLIISGSKAPGYSDSIIPQMVKAAKESNVVTILDIKGEDLQNSMTFEPDYIKHNLNEFTETFNNPYRLSTFTTNIIVTDGDNPVKFNCGNGVETIEVNGDIIPKNTTGCGDVFTASLAYSISEGKSIKDAIESAINSATLSATTNRPGYIKE